MLDEVQHRRCDRLCDTVLHLHQNHTQLPPLWEIAHRLLFYWYASDDVTAATFFLHFPCVMETVAWKWHLHLTQILYFSCCLVFFFYVIASFLMALFLFHQERLTVPLLIRWCGSRHFSPPGQHFSPPSPLMPSVSSSPSTTNARQDTTCALFESTNKTIHRNESSLMIICLNELSNFFLTTNNSMFFLWKNSHEANKNE